MSESKTAPSPAVDVQEPAPAYERESPPLGTTVQGNGPAPAREMPANLVQLEQPATPLAAQQQGGPTITPLANPLTVTPLHMLGDGPQWIDCPFCNQRTQTVITKEGTAMQMVAGALCCLFCVCLACVPCIAGWCENMHYSCARCKNRVATRPYDGTIQVFSPQVGGGDVPTKYATVAPPVAEKQQSA
ncbi:hypothetical protein CORC01_03510 [Colletotrichum orchidophilum]|uniref:LITAF domain-containing protein n=1 Tax=Colletotrichum orchidophilum TaxID=1209926 RepID=A0A1G4BII2_9PEZI|nr:uncharacterized protein CORC01_03510 [Colletotrichum orchidophilum]OHF01195.1 hypothetical protein CORC01_03510 [Colletotrichum orchidophilum]